MTIDLSSPATPTMVSAQVVEVIDGHRVRVEVVWLDNESREDEFCTNFTFSPDGGTHAVYASDYGAVSTGEKTGTVVAPKGQFQLTATCWRWAMTGAGEPVALGSAPSNALSIDTKGHGQGRDGNPNKPQ